MAPDLDARLRSALRLPAEPGATDETRSAVLAALPRYRARRRIAAAGVGVSLLGALVFGTVVITGTGAPGPTVAGGHGGAVATAAGSCVEVRIGSGPFACEGVPAAVAVVKNAPRSLGAESSSYSTAVPASAPRTLRSPPGRSVEVSLPGSSATWARVSVVSEGRVVRVVTRLRRLSGRAVATLGALARGTYEISAFGAATCHAETSCAAGQRTWTVTLTVG